MTHMPNFETLVDMAQNNPDQLEKLRHDMSQKIIDAAPDRIRRRLAGLQFQIDSQRKLAKNPMAACINISMMMHDSFDELRAALNHYTARLSEREQLELQRQQQEKGLSNVVQFPNQ